MSKTATPAKRARKSPPAIPTLDQYGNIQRAYDYFNKALFNGELAPCLLTLGRDVKKCYGYFHANQWQRTTDTDETCHTISLTPMHLSRPLREVLSTLVHEMVHLWQEDHGAKKSKNGYHNTEWGNKMKEIGLYPSSTGEEGGKETGQKVSHYILNGGAYEQAFNKLPDDVGLAWLGVQGLTKQKKADKNKVKYVCLECDLKCWAKPDVCLICGTCNEELEPVENAD